MKLHTIILATILLLGNYVISIAQEIDLTLQKMEFPDGVFETHDHYRFDRFKPAPLIKKMRKEKEISLYGGSPYLFEVDENKIKKESLDDFVQTVNIIWGYVYEGDLYVTDKIVTNRTGAGYAKVLLCGRFSLIPLAISALQKEAKESKNELKNFDEGYILDLKTGKVVSFNVKQLKKILKDKPKLLKEYESEKNQEAQRVSYLLKLNEEILE